ncbi:hypothetical protein [Streptomyces sp. NPDC020983]|uniref:hypothetical protein n=1 Tax=Streptomyces sp. NPDC020983 TaxID=3365106 RepID=UPI003792C017
MLGSWLVVTGGGVESTPGDAHERGFRVTLPVDAMTDRDIGQHGHSLVRVYRCAP